MKELALVTGGSGYFGSVLVSELHRRGAAVRIFDKNPPLDAPDGVEVVLGDIRDEAQVRSAVAGATVVYHNVALVPLAKDRAGFFTVNQDGTLNLLRASLDAGVKKVVHMSSSAIYGAPRENPVTENTPPEPQEDYGRAKLAAEGECKTYAQRGLDVTIIRPRTIMGHGRLGIMQILFEWIRTGKNVPVLGRGDNVYQFVHADDLARACLLAAERKGATSYNVGAENFCSMRETLEALCDHAGTGSRVKSLPRMPAEAMMRLTGALRMTPLGPYHALMYGRSMYFDCGRVKQQLGWLPRYGNVEMFKQSYDWYCANRERLATAPARSDHRSPVEQGVLELVSRFL